MAQPVFLVGYDKTVNSLLLVRVLSRLPKLTVSKPLWTSARSQRCHVCRHKWYHWVVEHRLPEFCLWIHELRNGFVLAEVHLSRSISILFYRSWAEKQVKWDRNPQAKSLGRLFLFMPIVKTRRYCQSIALCGSVINQPLEFTRLRGKRASIWIHARGEEDCLTVQYSYRYYLHWCMIKSCVITVAFALKTTVWIKTSGSRLRLSFTYVTALHRVDMLHHSVDSFVLCQQ